MRDTKELVVLFGCSRFLRHRQIVLATAHAIVEHQYTREAQGRDILHNFTNNFITTLHLVSSNYFLALLLFLHAVLEFAIAYVKAVSSTDSEKHSKIFESLYH